ncbi:MAG: HAD family hydrolase [Pseudomonadota bacterium]
MGKIKGILFDKDGTLFGFDETWSRWCADLITDYSEGDARTVAALADALMFDLERERFLAGSPVIAGTADVSAELMLPHLSGWTFETLLDDINRRAAAVEGVPPVALVPLMNTLRAAGHVLGVATNDAESSAHAQLLSAGIAEHMSFVAGYDSGFGAKPAPGMVTGFVAQTGLAADEVVMVGDSTHDLSAGRAAGTQTAGVLTGPASAEELSPLADVVLPDIGALTEWLGISAPA